MSPEAARIINLRDVLHWAAKSGALTDRRPISDFASAEELAEQVVVQCSLILEDFEGRRAPVDGLDTDLFNLDVDYVCEEHEIEMPAWATELVRRWPGSATGGALSGG
jgi:hypothetical protein